MLIDKTLLKDYLLKFQHLMKNGYWIMTIFLSAVLKIIFDVEKIIQNIFKKYTTGGT